MKKLIKPIGLALLLALQLSPALGQSTNSTTTKTPAVRDVAAKPSAYLGGLTLVGVVGIVTPEKGFILVDLKEYQEEGFGCLTTDEPTKISVQWTGAAPKVKDKVRVDGKLVKEKKGYAFVAEKVTKQ